MLVDRHHVVASAMQRAAMNCGALVASTTSTHCIVAFVVVFIALVNTIVRNYCYVTDATLKITYIA